MIAKHDAKLIASGSINTNQAAFIGLTVWSIYPKMASNDRWSVDSRGGFAAVLGSSF